MTVEVFGVAMVFIMFMIVALFGFKEEKEPEWYTLVWVPDE